MSALLFSLHRPCTRSGSLIALSALIILGCSLSAAAQVGGIDPDPGDRGTGGRSTIQGTIYFPGGRRLDRRVNVRLRGALGSQQATLSDDNGAFAFRRLQGGTYTLTVEAGAEFEIATETVDIIEPQRRRDEMGATFSVHITLQPKRAVPVSPPGAVDAASAEVPPAARDLYKQAVAAAQSGDRKKAIEQLNQAISISPSFLAALNELGVQYIALRQLSKATEVLQKALKMAPDSFYPRLNYGIALVQMKDSKSAVVELQRAVQQDGSSAAAHMHLGHAFANLGAYDDAEKQLRQSIAIGGDPSIAAHRFLGAVYVEKHDESRAIQELEVYLKLAPNAADADRIREVLKQLRAQFASKQR